MKKKIIIMDYCTSEVHIFTYDENAYEDYQDFYEHINEEEGFNFRDSQCYCMVVDELKLEIH